MIDQGPSWKKSTNFRMVGQSAKRFIDKLNTGGLKSYPWRLYAIRQFAQALTSGPALAMVNQLIEAKSDFGQLGAYPWAKEFSRHAGRGWGVTTVLHMLTDLGLAVKPDIHLRRSAVRMGLLEPIIPSNLSVNEIDSRASEFDPKIVTAIVGMARLVQPLAAPELPSVLREIDKTLMDWSKQGLLHPL